MNSLRDRVKLYNQLIVKFLRYFKKCKKKLKLFNLLLFLLYLHRKKTLIHS